MIGPLLLAILLTSCAVQTSPPRRDLYVSPARVVELPLDVGNNDHITVRGEGSILMTNFTAFFRTFCDTLAEVWSTLCVRERCLPRPWRIFVREKNPTTAVVFYPGRTGHRDTAGEQTPFIFREYPLGEHIGAATSTSKRAAAQVARSLAVPGE